MYCIVVRSFNTNEKNTTWNYTDLFPINGSIKLSEVKQPISP
jgi:hypothetical protein